MNDHFPTPPPEASKQTPPADKNAEQRSKNSSRLPTGTNKATDPGPASGDQVSLDDVLRFNGKKLWYMMSKLSRSPGRRVRAAFKEPNFETMTEAVSKLSSEPKGCARLRDLIGMGLQMGDLPAGRDGIWGVIIHLGVCRT